ncbi:hypothetical protein FZI10_20630 [Cronobacter sakazakii]|nr:hypothetical protein FZI10_20630 [Cronobacter sakazakii]
MDCIRIMDVKITIMQVEVANLRPNPWNTNSVGAQNFEKLKGSIEKLGFFKPILARELDGGFFEILGGEHRWRAAMEQGISTVPVISVGKINDLVAKQMSLFPVDCIGESESPYFSPSLIDDIAYLDRAVANYLSNLDAIIQDQTFSQLAIPVQSLLPGDENHTKVLEMGTKRVFTFDSESGNQPFYLSPDPKQAQMIITTIKTVINEIYHSVGVAGERTKQDNAQGIDNSSGVAKMYDFQRVNSLLVTKAERLERAERQMMQLVAKWMGISLDEENSLISYPESFDIRGLTDEFAVAEKLALLQAPDSVRRHQMEMLIEKVFPNISEAMKKEFDKDLLNFPPKNDLNTLENKSVLTYHRGAAQASGQDQPRGNGDSSTQETE